MTEVRVRSMCKKCGGMGIGRNPLWSEFWSEDAHKGKLFSIDEINAWFSDKGYSHVPSEEMDCLACRGIGYIESWLPLREVKTLLAGVV